MGDNQELLDAIANEPDEPVNTEAITKKAIELRDLYLQKADLEAQLKELGKRIQNIERDELTSMFTQEGISSISVDADGNHPAFVAQRSTVYSAAISDDKRMEAFQWFEQQGHGDLVKSVINIQFGMQEHEKRLRVMKLLSDAGIEFYNNESIHHMTLKAFVKRELQAGRIIPMDLLGVFVFDEVKIKVD